MENYNVRQFFRGAQSGTNRLVAKNNKVGDGTNVTSIGSWLGRKVSATLASVVDHTALFFQTMFNTSIVDRIGAENRDTLAHFQASLKTEYGAPIAHRLAQEFNLAQMERNQAPLSSQTVGQVRARALALNDQELTQRSPFVAQGVIPHAELDALRNEFGRDIVEALLMTEFMQNKLEAGMPLSSDRLVDLEAAADKLRSLQKNGCSSDSLCWHAENLLGEVYDFSNLQEAVGICRELGDKLNALRGLQDEPNPFAGIEAVPRGADGRNTDLEYEVYERLLDRTEHLLDNHGQDLPGFHREVLEGVADQLRTAVRGLIIKDVMDQVQSELTVLERSGGSRTREASIEIGVGASMFGVDVGSASSKVTLKYHLETGDDTKVRETNSASLSLSLTLGNDKLASVGAGGSAGIGKGTTYPSLEDYVRSQAEKLLDKHFPQASPARHQKFQGQLKMLGVLSPGDRVNLERQVPPNFVQTLSKNGKGSLALQILRFLNTTEGSKTKTTFTKSIGLQDALREQPDLLASANPNYFSVTWQGERHSKTDGQNLLNAVEYQLTALRGRQDSPSKNLEMAAVREDLRQAMHHLEGEFDHFCHLAKPEEVGKSVLRQQRAAKREIKADRGARTTEAYLEGVIHTFTRLSQLYQMTFADHQSPETQDAGFARNLERFGKKLMMPPLDIKPSKLPSRKMVMQGTNDEVSNTFQVKLWGSIEMSATVRFNHIENDANPDNDGDYIGLELAVSGGTSLMDILSGLEGSKNFKGFFEAMMGHKEAESAGLDFGKPVIDFSEVDSELFNMNLKAGAKIQMSFIKSEEGYRLQYTRLSATEQRGIEVPSVPIPIAPGGDLRLGLAASSGSSRNLTERLGTDTLTYIQTKFNNWANDGELDKGKWDQFVTSHRNQFSKIFQNIAYRDGNIRKEILANFRDMGQEHMDPEFDRAMRDFASNPRFEGAFDRAKAALTKYLMSQNERLYAPETARRFTVKSKRTIRGRIAKHLSLNLFHRGRPKTAPSNPLHGSDAANATQKGNPTKESNRRRGSSIDEVGGLAFEATGPIRNHGIPNVTHNNCFLSASLNVIASTPTYRQLFEPETIEANREAIEREFPDLDFADVRRLGAAIRTIVDPVQDNQPAERLNQAVRDILQAMDRLGLLPPARNPEVSAIEAQHDASEVLFARLMPLFDPNGTLTVGEFTTTTYDVDRMRPIRSNDPEQYTDVSGNPRVTDMTRSYVLRLPIGQARSLQDALDRYQSAEALRGVRARNGMQALEGPATRSIQAFGAPPVLNFALGRDSGLGQKDDHDVEIPDTIQFGGETYQLRAAVLHHGDSLDAGHYTTMRHDAEGWTHRDDSRVIPLTDPNQGQNQRALNKGFFFTYVRLDRDEH
ncbi:USP domain-containing protein [Sulfidibacter corallicola]|uniref:USP domain-containing protein n=1 Tax=Sulfidibacter corallicola TaxID=2818388 RepID=A0A8A4TDP5_SULCO|nr:ubiquitin carboxyl-terminal hydrolase family protein [Sulfidibacter corallicola]QTD47680.1 hypothetical protein J3U87_18975 [Sulfidibacter corallicola]